MKNLLLNFASFTLLLFASWLLCGLGFWLIPVPAVGFIRLYILMVPTILLAIGKYIAERNR